MLEQSRSESLQVEHQWGVAECTRALGKMQSEMHHYEKALKFLEESKALFAELESEEDVELCEKAIKEIQESQSSD